MTIKTKFNVGEFVYCIVNDKIKRLEIVSIDIEIYKNRHQVYCQLLVSKAQTLMDKDAKETREQSECFKTLSALTWAFKIKNKL